jgi:hypothetical protein
LSLFRIFTVHIYAMPSLPASNTVQSASSYVQSASIKWRSKLIRVRQWEFWPTQVVYFPVLVYYLYCAIKARALVFVSAVNPGMEMGGLFGETKSPMLKELPDNFKPKTIYPEPNCTIADIHYLLAAQGMTYPVVAKPDIGERGLLVEKISSDAEMQMYLDRVKVRFLVQEFIQFPLELGVFYYRHPDEEKGTISSIIIKEFLSVAGDGVNNLEQLLLQNDRGVLQLPKLYKRLGNEIYRVPTKGEYVLLEPIGNHSRGTKFVNGNHLINEELMRVFDRINSHSKGVYYGRYDIKCSSLEALYRGEDIRVMEINGAAAEPGHIYDPNCSIFTAWRVLIQHWGIVYQIARANHRKGASYGKVFETYRKFKRYLKYYDEVGG